MPDNRKRRRTAGAIVLFLTSLLTLAWGAGALDGLTVSGKKNRGAGARPPRDQVTREMPPRPKGDVIYVPTPQGVVDQMLELAEVKPGDVVYDLGCGDGRIVVTAAKRFGARAVGFEIDPVRVAEANENVRKNGVEHLVTIKEGDLFEADLSPASVVTMYLLSTLNVRLKPKLAALKPGTRIVSQTFDMRGAKPRHVEPARVPPLFGESNVYLWVVPWEEE